MRGLLAGRQVAITPKPEKKRNGGQGSQMQKGAEVVQASVGVGVLGPVLRSESCRCSGSGTQI